MYKLIIFKLKMLLLLHEKKHMVLMNDEVFNDIHIIMTCIMR